MNSPRQIDGCAVMFVGMRGFTRASAQLGEHEVVRLLEGYFAMVADLTTAHGGRPCNMAGDGVLAAFGLDRAPREADAATGPAPQALRASASAPAPARRCSPRPYGARRASTAWGSRSSNSRRCRSGAATHRSACIVCPPRSGSTSAPTDVG